MRDYRSPAYSRVRECLSKHKLYSVDLVDLGSSRVKIHRHDIALRVLTAKFADNSLARYMIPVSYTHLTLPTN